MTVENTFIRFAQIACIVVGCALFVLPAAIFPTYYKPIGMGITALVYVVLIQLPVFIFCIPRGATGPEAEQKRAIRTRLQMALSLGLLMTGLGSLGLWGLYKVGIHYDKFVHFAFCALLMISGVAVLRVWHGWSTRKAILVLGFAMAVCGIAWELIEFSSDRWLHFGFFGHLFDTDSVHDIVFNLLGISGGAGVVLWRSKRSENGLIKVATPAGMDM